MDRRAIALGIFALAGACTSKGEGDAGGGATLTSEATTIDGTTTSTSSSASTSSATSTSASTSTTASTATISSSTTAPDTSPDTSSTTMTLPPDPVADCQSRLDPEACAAGYECVFLPGSEGTVVDDLCVLGQYGAVGFCYHQAGGGNDTPSAYYEIETGRVFVFANTPTPAPTGWTQCTCDPPSPDACIRCGPECVGDTTG